MLGQHVVGTMGAGWSTRTSASFRACCIASQVCNCPSLGKNKSPRTFFSTVKDLGVRAGPVLGHCLVRALSHRNPMGSPLRRSQQLSRQLPGAASPTPEPQDPSPPQPRSFPHPIPRAWCRGHAAGGVFAAESCTEPRARCAAGGSPCLHAPCHPF